MIKLNTKLINGDYRTARTKGFYAMVCGSIVKDLFEIPEEVKAAVFYLKEKPSRQSYKCVWDGTHLDVELTDGSTVRHTTYSQFDDYFHEHFPQLLNKPFYVSVRY